MPVRKVGGSWWVDFRHNYVRHRKRSLDNTRAGAQAYEAALRAALARGEDIAPTKKQEATFADFAWRWLDTYARANNKPSEVRAKRSVLGVHLVPRFGALPLPQVSGMAVEAFKGEQRGKGLAAKTVNNQLAVLRRCLRSAEEWGLLQKAPAIKALRAAQPPLRWLDASEQERLLRASRSLPAWAPAVLLALRTGMRLGELLGLDWDDIDWERRTVTVRRSFVAGVLDSPKNHRTRHVHLPSDAAAALYPLRQAEGPVFRRRSGGRQAAFMAARKIKRIERAAGLRGVAWHTLRHTYATTLAMAGVPLPVLMKLLGHSSIAMTMRYVHVSPHALQEAADAVDGALRSPWSTRGQPVVNGAFPLSVPYAVPA